MKWSISILSHRVLRIIMQRVLSASVFTLAVQAAPAGGTLVSEYVMPSEVRLASQLVGSSERLWFQALLHDSEPPNAPWVGWMTPAGDFSTEVRRLTAFRFSSIGPDLNLWVHESDALVRIAPSGATAMFEQLGTHAVWTPGGDLWSATLTDTLLKFNLSGALTRFPLPSTLGFPSHIVSGPGADIWFSAATDATGGGITWAVAKVSPHGEVSQVYSLDAVGAVIQSLKANADVVWFTASSNDGALVGRVTEDSEAAVFAIARMSPSGFKIVTPDGNLWLQQAASLVERVTAAGEIQEFALPEGASTRSASAVIGKDGNIWFPISSTGRAGVARLTPDGTYTLMALDYAAVAPLVGGPGGDLWFLARRAADQTAVLVRLDVSEAPPAPTVAVTAAATSTRTTIPTQYPNPTATPIKTYSVDSFTLKVGSTAGMPGSQVTVDVQFRTSRRELTAVQNDLLFAPHARVAEKHEGVPDCAVNPSIQRDGSQFGFLPTGCVQENCTGVRALIVPLTVSTPIPDNTVLYACSYLISTDAEPGTSVEIGCDQAVASGTDGDPVSGVCENGTVTVLGPTRTPTGTPRRDGTSTRAASATVTDTGTSTPTPYQTATRTGTGTSTPRPSPTPTATPRPCAGDCNGDAMTLVSELITAVNVALGQLSISACAAADRNGDSGVSVNELIAAVNAALTSCSN